jgi:hypothetical protein
MRPGHTDDASQGIADDIRDSLWDERHILQIRCGAVRSRAGCSRLGICRRGRNSIALNTPTRPRALPNRFFEGEGATGVGLQGPTYNDCALTTQLAPEDAARVCALWGAESFTQPLTKGVKERSGMRSFQLRRDERGQGEARGSCTGFLKPGLTEFRDDGPIHAITPGLDSAWAMEATRPRRCPEPFA